MKSKSDDSEHEPPKYARATFSVHRDPDDLGAPWGDVEERHQPEAAADHGGGRRTQTDHGTLGDAYARPSKHRACMRAGVTDLDGREEEREAPGLLKRYRGLLARRPVLADVGHIRAITGRLFGAVEQATVTHWDVDLAAAKGEPRPKSITMNALLAEWARHPSALHAALAAWITHPALVAAIEGASTDSSYRRKREHKGPRPAFSSAASVIRTAIYGGAVLGVGTIDLERLRAESKGRTRSRWNEVFCRPTHVPGSRAPGLRDVERRADALKGLAGIELSDTDREAILDADDHIPLDDRLLAYRARLLGGYWCVNAADAENLRSEAEHLRKATAHISDREIQNRIGEARKLVERHLRRLPAANARALREGHPKYVADASNLVGLIPARKERRPKAIKRYEYREGIRVEVSGA